MVFGVLSTAGETCPTDPRPRLVGVNEVGINYNVPPASPVASVVVFFEIWAITIWGGCPARLVCGQNFYKVFRQYDIAVKQGISEERGDGSGGETCYATSNRRYQEL